MSNTADDVQADAESGLTYSDIEEFLANPIPHTLRPEVSVQVEKLEEFNTAILERQGSVGFVTSDNPCAWFDPAIIHQEPNRRGLGLNSETIEITLPVSPRQLLLFSRNIRSGYFEVSEDCVNEMNRRTIMRARKHFIFNRGYLKPTWFNKNITPCYP